MIIYKCKTILKSSGVQVVTVPCVYNIFDLQMFSRLPLPHRRPLPRRKRIRARFTATAGRKATGWPRLLIKFCTRNTTLENKVALKNFKISLTFLIFCFYVQSYLKFVFSDASLLSLFALVSPKMRVELTVSLIRWRQVSRC